MPQKKFRITLQTQYLKKAWLVVFYLRLTLIKPLPTTWLKLAADCRDVDVFSFDMNTEDNFPFRGLGGVCDPGR